MTPILVFAACYCFGLAWFAAEAAYAIWKGSDDAGS